MAERQPQLDFIESIFDLPETIRNLPEKPTWASQALVNDRFVNLNIEDNQFNIRGHTHVYLLLIELLDLIFTFGVTSIHSRHEDGRSVADALSIQHILNDATDALRTLGKLLPKPLVRQFFLAVIEV